MTDFKNLNAFQERNINFILDEFKEKNERLKPIRAYLDKTYYIEQITEVNDYQIAKIKRKTGNTTEIMYSTFLDFKPLNVLGVTMDEAILICIAHKYEGRNSDFPIYASRMLGVNFDSEIEC